LCVCVHACKHAGVYKSLYLYKNVLQDTKTEIHSLLQTVLYHKKFMHALVLPSTGTPKWSWPH